MLTVKQPGAPDAGNLHVRCDEGRERTGGTDPPRLLYWSPPRVWRRLDGVQTIAWIWALWVNENEHIERDRGWYGVC